MSKTNGTVNHDSKNGAVLSPAALPTKAEYTKLFSAYDTAVAALMAHDTKREKLLAARSAAVEAITTACGGKKGPFRHPTTGQVVSAVNRTNKETGDSAWYFKSPGTSDIIEPA